MFENDSAERLDTPKLLSGDIEMHAQALGYIFNVAPMQQGELLIIGQIMECVYEHKRS